MKTKIIVATIAAALVITFVSCDLFRSKKKVTAFNIEGQWIIDSIENKGSDSSGNIGMLALVLAAKDSLPLGIQFNNDSSFYYLNAVDSAKGRYYLSEDRNSLFIKEDSTYTQLNFLSRSDSAFNASTPDSVVYYLKKK
jgi:hypothetical protein